jgi:ABC-type enterochelin transport system permease subunit
VHRGLRERGVDTKKKAAQIVGNMSSLVTEPLDMIPYIGLLLPEVKKVFYASPGHSILEADSNV